MPLLGRSGDKMSQANKIQRTAMYIAKVVRNAMEDFHTEHLSDEQMAELNPIIRNAIYTALYAKDRKFDLRARMFVMFINRTIPDYWELPQLIDDFAEGSASDDT